MPAVLVKHMPQHHVALPWEIDVVIGKNGMIWITRAIPDMWKEHEGNLTNVTDDDAPLAETLQRLKQRHAATPLTPSERLNIARVHNVISCLALLHRAITPDSISALYQRTVDMKLDPKVFSRSINLLRCKYA